MQQQNQQPQGRPWYKIWWVWALIIVILFIIGSLIGGGSSDDSADSKADHSTATAHKTTQKEKTDSSSAAAQKTISLDYDDYTVANEKAYQTDFNDTSWPAANVKVDKVTIYKLAKSYKYKSANDGTFQMTGIARVHFTIKANRDISIYPTQGTAVYSNGEQHGADSMENWDGDISKDATKSGNVTVPIKDLQSTSALKTIRFKFDANYDTNDDDDDNSNKTFDFTLNLNK